MVDPVELGIAIGEAETRAEIAEERAELADTRAEIALEATSEMGRDAEAIAAEIADLKLSIVSLAEIINENHDDHGNKIHALAEAMSALLDEIEEQAEDMAEAAEEAQDEGAEAAGEDDVTHIAPESAESAPATETPETAQPEGTEDAKSEARREHKQRARYGFRRGHR